MRLRAAQHEDSLALAEIAAESYRTTFARILEPEALAQRGVGFFETHFRAVLDRVRVAVLAQRVVGFSQISGGHLDMLFVAPGRHGEGVGAALLDDVERAGIRTLECFRDNLAARAFYERHGWRFVRGYEREFIGRNRAFVFYEKR
ncbi:MAG: GNAT family N-acetyltransferase [Proteobacteria bacterium]|nr:GNAT family N-acetyltransferase [Pseudomonadota bacterium]